jgi:hypothetical protein
MVVTASGSAAAFAADGYELLDYSIRVVAGF